MTEAHTVSAVDLSRMRVAALRAGEERAPKTRRWLCRTVTERCLDRSAAFLGEAETRRRRPRYDHRRGECSVERKRRPGHQRRKWERARNEGRHAGRQVVRKLLGSLTASTIVSIARQVGNAQGAGELEAAANIQRLAVSYLDRASLAQAGPKFPVAAEKELRTLAEASDVLMSGQMMAAMDIIRQRFRAVETSILEEGGWSVARHLEVVPDTKVSLVTPGLRAMIAAEERQSHRVRQDLVGLMETTAGPALETVHRASELKKESGRKSISLAAPTISPVQWPQP